MLFFIQLSIGQRILPNTFYAKRIIPYLVNLRAYYNIVDAFLLKIPILFAIIGLILIIYRLRKPDLKILMYLGIIIFFMYAMTYTIEILPHPWVFYMFRYFIPVIPFIYLLCFEGLSSVSYKHSKQISIVVLVIFFIVSAVFLLDSMQLYAVSNRYFDDIYAKQGRLFTDQDVVATFDVGAVKYFSGSDVIDMAGLNDRNLLLPRSLDDVSKTKEHIMHMEIDYFAVGPETIPFILGEQGVREIESFLLCPSDSRYPCSGTEDDVITVFKVLDKEKARQQMLHHYADKYAYQGVLYFQRDDLSQAIFFSKASVEMLPTKTALANLVAMCTKTADKECVQMSKVLLSQYFPDNNLQLV